PLAPGRAVAGDCGPLLNRVLRGAPMWVRGLVSFLAVAAFAAACAGADEAAEQDESEELSDSLRARAGETTVWMDRSPARVGDRFPIHGSASRNLTGGNAFVFDDPYGELTISG